MTTTDIEIYQEGLEYSEEVKNAVRYGYLYRKEAELIKDDRLHFNIVDASDILYWIANMIIGGLGWDLIKYAVKKTYEWISKRGVNADKEASDILTDEMHLKTFYIYIKEFDEHHMSVDDRTFKYIKEEIIADYTSDRIGSIYSQEHRIPEIDECNNFAHEALAHAEKMLYGELKTQDTLRGNGEENAAE